MFLLLHADFFRKIISGRGAQIDLECQTDWISGLDKDLTNGYFTPYILI